MQELKPALIGVSFPGLLASLSRLEDEGVKVIVVDEAPKYSDLKEMALQIDRRTKADIVMANPTYPEQLLIPANARNFKRSAKHHNKKYLSDQKKKNRKRMAKRSKKQNRK